MSIIEMIQQDLEAMGQLNPAQNQDVVEAEVAKIVESKKFAPAPTETVKDDDLVIGEMTPRQKALLSIFQNEESAMEVRECAHNMIQIDIRQDPRVVAKENCGKEGLGMCENYMIVLY